MNNFKKLIILEGFKQNGYYHRNQRIFLRIKSCVKIDFRHFFWKNMIVDIEISIFDIKTIDNYMI